MAARKYSFLVVFMATSCAVASSQYSVEVENHLSQCIEIESTETYNQNNKPYAKIKYREISSIANCGCKSALSSYSVHAVDKEYQSFLMGGKFSFYKTESLTLPLAVDHRIIGNRPIRISLSCASPD